MYIVNFKSLINGQREWQSVNVVLEVVDDFYAFDTKEEAEEVAAAFEKDMEKNNQEKNVHYLLNIEEY